MPRPRLDEPAVPVSASPRRPIPIPSLQEYENGLAIDEHALQQECRTQPTMFYHVARDYGRAVAANAEAESNLKRITAEVDLHVRATAEREGIHTTEARIKAFVLADDRVRNATREVSRTRLIMEELDALKQSYYHRRDMLEKLVELYLGNYYSDPIRGAARSMRDEAVEGVREARRREQERQRRRQE